MFESLNLPLSINTSEDNPNKLFFCPVLSLAKQYDVGVGYFSSGWILAVAEGIANFTKNKGTARWIISHEIKAEDLDVILNANSFANKKYEAQRIFDADVETIFKELVDEARSVLAWLVRDNIVAIKIALPRNKLTGMFHAKNGIFTDSTGNKIAFSGSYNLTAKAPTNWEVIDIYCSWHSAESAERCKIKQSEFEKIWNNLDVNLMVFEPSEESIKKIHAYTSNYSRPYEAEIEFIKPKIPNNILDSTGRLRNYQEQAISNWFSANGRGLFCMATGSGKTITALSAATKLVGHLLKNKLSIVIVITVPLKHLAEQWALEADPFGFETTKCYGSKKLWLSEVQIKYNHLIINKSGYILIIVVNASFRNKEFQAFLSGITTHLLIISDEVHNMGAKEMLPKLPTNAQFRIGLSATPIRHNDPFGTKALFEYFGEPIIEFNINHAISAGYLCKYFYYPIVCIMDDDEFQEYIILSKKIAKLIAIDDESNYSDNLKMLLIRRAKIIGRCADKKTALKRELIKSENRSHTLIYTSDAVIDNVKEVDSISFIAGNQCGWKVSKFTAEQSPAERKEVLNNFKNGTIDALISIKCLDEGVDIPQTKTAYILASSTNSRQFIQRRGRVLRKYPGKNHAYIYDFITIPPLEKLGLDIETFKIEKAMLEKELVRIKEFAEIAENPGYTLEVLREVKKKFNILGL